MKLAAGEIMAEASAENQWELRIERQVPLRRHVAYRVMVNRLAEWWWYPFSDPVSDILVNWRSGGVFRVRMDSREVLQEATVLDVRPGWYFYLTDAIISRRPGTPSMVGSWSFATTPRDRSTYTDGICSTYVSVIRHFSEADYLRSRALGFEQGWNDAADRLVEFCESRPRPS
jgi:uncharacterized protein YndB with AHSA1/START domain